MPLSNISQVRELTGHVVIWRSSATGYCPVPCLLLGPSDGSNYGDRVKLQALRFMDTAIGIEIRKGVKRSMVMSVKEFFERRNAGEFEKRKTFTSQNRIGSLSPKLIKAIARQAERADNRRGAW